MKRVIVIGGGASGLMAAIMAARGGAKVILAEKNRQAGKKLLVTGNGRCNFTNRRQEPSCYRSEYPQLTEKILNAFSMEDTVAFFVTDSIFLCNQIQIFTGYNRKDMRHASQGGE